MKKLILIFVLIASISSDVFSESFVSFDQLLESPRESISKINETTKDLNLQSEEVIKFCSLFDMLNDSKNLGGSVRAVRSFSNHYAFISSIKELSAQELNNYIYEEIAKDFSLSDFLNNRADAFLNRINSIDEVDFLDGSMSDQQLQSANEIFINFKRKILNSNVTNSDIQRILNFFLDLQKSELNFDIKNNKFYEFNSNEKISRSFSYDSMFFSDEFTYPEKVFIENGIINQKLDFFHDNDVIAFSLLIEKNKIKWPVSFFDDSNKKIGDFGFNGRKPYLELEIKGLDALNVIDDCDDCTNYIKIYLKDKNLNFDYKILNYDGRTLQFNYEVGRKKNYFDVLFHINNILLMEGKVDINKDFFENGFIKFSNFHKNGKLLFKDSLGDVCSNRLINFYDDKGLKIDSLPKIKLYYYLYKFLN